MSNIFSYFNHLYLMDFIKSILKRKWNESISKKFKENLTVKISKEEFINSPVINNYIKEKIKNRSNFKITLNSQLTEVKFVDGEIVLKKV